MKGLPQFLKRDPAALLARDRHALSAAQAKLADLQRQRSGMLVEADSFEPIVALDRSIAETRAGMAILQDRLKALTLECRRAEHQKLLAAREAALSREIVPAFERMCQLAERLEGAVLLLAESYRDLMAEERALNATWPTSSVPKPQWWSGAWSTTDLSGRLTQACRWGASGSLERFAEFASIGSKASIADQIRKQCEFSLEQLRAVEIPLPRLAEDADDEPATATVPVTGFASMATAP